MSNEGLNMKRKSSGDSKEEDEPEAKRMEKSEDLVLEAKVESDSGITTGGDNDDADQIQPGNRILVSIASKSPEKSNKDFTTNKPCILEEDGQEENDSDFKLDENEIKSMKAETGGHDDEKNICESSINILNKTTLEEPTETPDIIFACDICDFKDTIDKVRNHKASRHGSGLSRQRIGLKVAVDSGPAKKRKFVGIDEYFSVEDTNRMKCRQCSMILQTKSVPDHIVRCSGNKFFCALCCSGFITSELLQQHKLENHHQCEICGREFIDAGDFLQRHQDKCRKMKELASKMAP